MKTIEFQLLLLIIVANGAPIVGKDILGRYGAWPLDGALLLPDGRRLLGHSKTYRGVLLALIATTLTAWVIGLSPYIGLTIGACAMAGDLFSSFAKRRLGLAPSSMAFGLDQIPETLLPLLAVKAHYGLGWLSLLKILAVFIILELLLSRLLYRLNLRNRPY
jgi:CDP-diglyceride synthetase